MFTANIHTVGQGNGSTTTLPLEVFTQRNFIANFIRLNLNFITYSLLEPPFGELGVTYAFHPWKARGRLHIRDNWTFFASSYGSDFITRYWWKWAFFKGVGHIKRKFQGKETAPTNLCWCPKTTVITLLYCIKISAVDSFVSSQSMHHAACDRQTDGRTDGQNYDLQDRANIAATRGKNQAFSQHFVFFRVTFFQLVFVTAAILNYKRVGPMHRPIYNQFNYLYRLLMLWKKVGLREKKQEHFRVLLFGGIYIYIYRGGAVS